MINRACPGFQIGDMNTTLDWYADFLRFDCTFKVPGEREAPYAIVSRDEVSIHLRLIPNNQLTGQGFCYIQTHHIDRLSAELDAAGVIFIRQLEDSAYGMRDFVIKDYEGNQLSFGESIQQS